ncbi:MAG: phosphatidylethanolamine/phosphatidyl-N-methylethanolamine N-methyltransferase [Clostridiales bacterium]|jgi:ubiquinone/menaquinone biosynthesis C-methylase UbiE|nr:phosphatidylethanolamine/phosphatidyl-N-methylethanolamine N-methyltransferase [Clostridiales bacterium]MDN5300454.1 phosphatidylethanolamine/phosphatidyl-N-methylethanolamine N-methyltransferase [Clostridiales bacterium]
MKNTSNVQKYRRMAKYYDFFFEKLLKGGRKRALSLLAFSEGQKVLLVGVGTGLDLPFINEHCHVTAIDLSQAMLSIAQKKFENREINWLQMNAEELTFEDQAYDVAILSLILSVVENPQKAFSESLRVLKPNGKLLVFDKFNEGRVSVLRQLLNLLTSALGTDINRAFGRIAEGFPIDIIADKAVMIAGSYRGILIGKRNE